LTPPSEFDKPYLALGGEVLAVASRHLSYFEGDGGFVSRLNRA